LVSGLQSHESVYKLISRYITNPHLRQVFSFHPLLIGGNPFLSSSMYSMIHYLERKWGVHSAIGGTGEIVRALLDLFARLGGELHLNARVEKIEITDGAATGVALADGRRFPARVVVSNGDLANTYRKLIAPEWRRKWTDRKLERK
jgi:phytoene desaturase